MSYPAFIQPLIIEDEPGPKEWYEEIFQALSTKYHFARACFATCYDDAIEYLQSDQVLHLVVLDLRLPRVYGLPAEPGVDLGLDLLKKFAARDRYPIPAMLVMSGELGSADQNQLRHLVNTGFAHGNVLVKGGDYNKRVSEIESSLDAVRRYCGIGVHLRDSRERSYPTITPRDEDLMRRVVLRNETGIGVDVEWWSANATRTAVSQHWTKVLMGRILFEDDKPSRPNFFKFIWQPNAEAVIGTALRMHHKLSHIKVNGAVSSPNASLIVTEKVGSQDDYPISMPDFLGRTSIVPARDLEVIAEQIASQVEKLGSTFPQTATLKSLLWKWHNTDTVREAWEKYGESSALTKDAKTLEVFEQLRESTELVRFKQQSFVHGDLHLGNIALDVGGSSLEAFVFDAGGSGPAVNTRDLAQLEVSALIHQPSGSGASLVKQCKGLYGEEFIPSELESGEGSNIVTNTYHFVRQLRLAASRRTEPRLHALMVFDYAMIQVGGLASTLSGNKIVDPYAALELAALASTWYMSLKSD